MKTRVRRNEKIFVGYNYKLKKLNENFFTIPTSKPILYNLDDVLQLEHLVNITKWYLKNTNKDFTKLSNTEQVLQIKKYLDSNTNKNYQIYVFDNEKQAEAYRFRMETLYADNKDKILIYNFIDENFEFIIELNKVKETDIYTIDTYDYYNRKINNYCRNIVKFSKGEPSFEEFKNLWYGDILTGRF